MIDENTTKILVIDDSSVMRKAIIELLGKNIKATFFEAEDGEEGLAQFHAIKPDLVTLDINMPKMDGIETLNRIIAVDKCARVVMLTTESEKNRIVEAVSNGAKSYIVKPIDENKAVEKILKVLEK